MGRSTVTKPQENHSVSAGEQILYSVRKSRADRRDRERDSAARITCLQNELEFQTSGGKSALKALPQQRLRQVHQVPRQFAGYDLNWLVEMALNQHVPKRDSRQPELSNHPCANMQRHGPSSCGNATGTVSPNSLFNLGSVSPGVCRMLASIPSGDVWPEAANRHGQTP